jgi:uncharacterized protein YyaL (SSP411 family)
MYLAVVVGGGALGAEEGKEGKKANRLLDEKSPYLLQHAYNPVDWYPWGEEAFERARKEQKPILLSVGYSTCHWCHVMERESFEDEEIAKFLNAHFIPVKLDREERPDVDRVYMTTYQAMSGQGGGWPLNMFLTADLKPIFGGTYFPPRARGGRPGFLEILQHLEKLWREDGDKVRGTASESYDRLQEFLKEQEKKGAEEGALTGEILNTTVADLLENGDQTKGGWGGPMGPKFPQPSHLRFLMRCGDQKAKEFAFMTCRKMMHGGIYDQLMGGFHRYSVDAEWLVPHFEKMLYDQAQLIDVYLDAWLLSGDDEFRRVAEEIAEYVLRDLTHEEGGFWSAQDAGSEGKEGKCFCWTEAQLKSLLSEEEFAVVKARFGVTPKGNFVDHSDPDPLLDQNILSVVDPGKKLGEAEGALLASGRKKLRAERLKRVPPATDDKVLASWNGLMIAALARAGRVLDESRYLAAAKKAHGFVVAKLWDEKADVLYHRWREGERDTSQQAESYLYFLRGSRVLYEMTLEKEYLELAIRLAESARKKFHDEEHGGFYDGEVRKDLVMRLKDDFDSALPTPGSVGAVEFLVLGEMLGRDDFREVGRKTLKGAAATFRASTSSLPERLRALDFDLSKPSRLVLTEGKGRDLLLKVGWSGYRRNFVVLGNKGPLDEFTLGLTAKDGESTAYLCVGQACRLPETEAARVGKMLLMPDPAPAEE